MTILKIIFLLIAFQICVSCNGSLLGTDHGNPNSSSPNLTTNIQSLVTTACARVNVCFSNITTSNCETDLLANTSAPTEIGKSSYTNLTAVKSAESAGSLTANSTNVSQCSNAIQNASCSNSAVFDSGLSSNTTSQLYKVFRASSSCASIYN